MFRSLAALTLLLLSLASSSLSQRNALQPGSEPAKTSLSIEKVNKRALSAVEKAIAEYETMLSRGSRDAVVLNNLGVMYFLNGRLFESQSMLRKAADLAPGSTQIRVNLAFALNKTYNPASAIEILESVLKEEPEYYRARMVLCDIYATEKRLADASKCYEDLRAIDKMDAVTAANYSTVLIDSGETQRALDLLRWADAKFPDDAGIKNGLGVVLFQTKKYAQAETALRRAAEIEPKAAQVRYNLALTQMAVNKRGDMLEQYKFLKAADPELAGQLYKLIFRDKIVSVAPQR